MTTHNLAWLKLTNEDALEPEIPIVDPHHHLWDHPESYPESQLIQKHARHYLLDDFLKDISGGHNILQTLFVQCWAMYRQDGPQEMKPVGETEFVQGIAAQSASGLYGKTKVATGIVGYADIALGSSVAPILEAHLTAGKNRLRGIRYLAAWDASPEIWSLTDDPHILLNPKFREGLACLQKYNLNFETAIYFPQHKDLLNLAKAFPEMLIISNHIGGILGVGPYKGKKEEVFQEWKKEITPLAACPNVILKLGGLGMTPTGFGQHERPVPPGSGELAKAFAPYFNHCIEKFGVDRCMFASNFPVDKVSYSYTVLWNAFKRMTKDFSKSERANLFHDTAVKVYRL